MHTQQSDGYQMVEEVVQAYRRAGFSIIAITDHDWNRPNEQVRWNNIPRELASPYPKKPRPENYPANPTWPWTDYGCPSPDEEKTGRGKQRKRGMGIGKDREKIMEKTSPKPEEEEMDYLSRSKAKADRRFKKKDK